MFNNNIFVFQFDRNVDLLGSNCFMQLNFAGFNRSLPNLYFFFGKRYFDRAIG